MKRFLSVLLAAVMLLSMVTVSYADEPITVEYWNANTSTIVLELSDSVSTAELEYAITLTGPDGVISGANYEVNAHTTPAGAHSTTQIAASDHGNYAIRALTPNSYTYTIELTEGAFEFDEEYRLDIAASLLGGAYGLKFTVNKIAVENFATEAWTKDSSGTSVTVADNALTVVDAYARLNHSTSISALFADTGVKPSSWRNNANNPAADQINLEVKVNVADTSAAHAVGFGIANHINTFSLGDNALTGWAGISFGANANGERRTAAFLAKGRESDPNADYGDLAASTTYFGAATNVNASNMIYDTPDYAITEAAKTSPFTQGQSTKLSMFYDKAEAEETGKIIFGADGEFYNYDQDMSGITTIRANPYLLVENTTATFTDLIMSYATGSEIVAFEFDGPTFWNAASDTITLDFDNPFVASELQDGLVLIDEDGDEVEGLTVKKLTDITRTDYITGKHTYQVTVPGGFTDDAVYTLLLSAGTYNDTNGGTGVLVNDYAVTFSVDIILVEDFYNDGAYALNASSSYSSSSSYGTPWGMPFTSGRKGVMTIKAGAESNQYAEITTTGRAWFAPAAQSSQCATYFANTGVVGYSYRSQEQYKNLTDYTTEVDVKVSSSAGYSIRLQQTDKYNTTGTNYNYFTVKKTSAGAVSTQVALMNGSATYFNNLETGSASSADYNALAAAAPNANEYVRLSMSIKGEDHKWQIGDVVQHQTTTTATPSNYGIIAFDVDNGFSGNTWSIDNIIQSKATEISGMTVSDIVINNDASIESLAGLGLINAAVSVQNYGSGENCVALLAVYNSADESMVDVYISNTTAIAAADTTEVAFTNVDVSEGDSIAVYIWDGLKNLVPFTTAKVFPKN